MQHKILFVKLLLGFLVLALFFTYLSKQIYFYTLPKVTIVGQTSGVITKQINANGNFQYKDKTIYKAAAACGIEKIYVNVGDKITAGDNLIQLNRNDIQAAQYQQNIQISKLQEQKKEMVPVSDAYKLNDLQIAALNENLKDINTLLNNDCIVKSKADGIVTDIAIKDGTNVSKDLEMLSIASQKDDMHVVWSLKSTDAVYLKVEDSVTISLKLIDEKNKETTENVTSVVSNILYNVKENDYSFTSTVLPQGKNTIHLLDGEVVPVKMIYQSKQEYSNTVPLSAVTFLDGGIHKGMVYVIQVRKKNFGIEEYVKPYTFQILDIGDLNVASDVAIGFDKNNKVVTSTTKPLQDSQAVRVDKK